MSNKEHAWRLKDEEGNYMGVEPPKEGEAVITLGGKEIMRTQSIGLTRQGFYTSIGTEIDEAEYARRLMSLYSAQGVAEQDREFRMEYEGQYTVTSILDEINQEMYRYVRTFGQEASYISLSQRAYESYYMEQTEQPIDMRGGNSEERFRGLSVICNPLQERDVMVLGHAVREGIERSLYR